MATQARRTNSRRTYARIDGSPSRPLTAGIVSDVLCCPPSNPDTVRRLEGPMKGMLPKLQLGLLSLAMFAVLRVAASAQAPGTGVIVFEGARVIVGDGRAPIENASFIVSGARFTQVGRAGEVPVPAGATRVSLAGKTVMPTIVDTHTHLSQTREMLLDDLRRRAYFGVG